MGFPHFEIDPCRLRSLLVQRLFDGQIPNVVRKNRNQCDKRTNSKNQDQPLSGAERGLRLVATKGLVSSVEEPKLLNWRSTHR
jgi:hypothetical protein